MNAFLWFHAGLYAIRVGVELQKLANGPLVKVDRASIVLSMVLYLWGALWAFWLLGGPK